MPVWRRYLVKETSGRLVELPSRLYDRADDGTAPIPDFAGRCVEMVAAVMVGATGRDVQVTEVSFTKLYFDQSGFVDQAKRDRMIRLMLESCADRRCPEDAKSPARLVVDGAGRSSGKRSCAKDCAMLARRADAARHELMRDFGWKPAPADMDAVRHVLDVHGVGDRTTTPAMTKPAMTKSEHGAPTVH
ncbi:hypothetical protein [Azospirillum rugosum]|uniref:Uncharacterized protein n=1 Tax=Azospirillum rugosum TaxID=416170 RepID=A0ABS4SIU6_9PROT|nr:hypothetical protein [Azospirillum rugosum]MBP2292486.1 hypothetical protein [Azospirillum rugosum]MDQ0526490.1 hypothetical protein [Azospirillum rugosum]